MKATLKNGLLVHQTVIGRCGVHQMPIEADVYYGQLAVYIPDWLPEGARKTYAVLHVNTGTCVIENIRSRARAGRIVELLLEVCNWNFQSRQDIIADRERIIDRCKAVVSVVGDGEVAGLSKENKKS